MENLLIDQLKTPWLHSRVPGVIKSDLSMTRPKHVSEMGMVHCECDIRLTKDKKIVIFHDKNLKRLAGTNQKIKDLTYDQLQEYRLEHNTKIPLLDHIIPLINQVKALNVEIKSDGIIQGFDILNTNYRIMENS